MFLYFVCPEVIWKAELKVVSWSIWPEETHHSLSSQGIYWILLPTLTVKSEIFRNPVVCKTGHQVWIGIRRVPLLQLSVPFKRSYLFSQGKEKGFLGCTLGISWTPTSPIKGMASMNFLPSSRPLILKPLSTQKLDMLDIFCHLIL
jgi:hypothetical protein